MIESYKPILALYQFNSKTKRLGFWRKYITFCTTTKWIIKDRCGGKIDMTDQFSIILSIIAVITSVVSAVIVYKQTHVLKQTNMLPIVIDMFKEFRSPEFKHHQEYIYNQLTQECDPQKTGYTKLPEAARIHVIVVSHFFDNLGLLVASGIVSEDLVLSFLGGPVISTWNLLEPYIYQERKWRNGIYQDHFEHLAALSLLNPQSKIMEKLNLLRVKR
jgi:hypothetical protein